MRARNIKPGFFKNEKLAECHPLARILFSGLWCCADREGRLEDRPKRIKAEVIPYDNCDCEKLLAELEKNEFIQRYEVDKNKYIQIINFKKHQNPHCRESDSTIPVPTKAMSSQEKAMPSPADILIPDSLIPDILIPDSPSSIPEPQKSDSEIMLKIDPVFIEIPLVGKDEEAYPVTENKIAEYERLYPSVDVRQELRNMKGWCDANPTRRKTKRGVRSFINTWLSKAQDRGGRKTTGSKLTDGNIAAAQSFLNKINERKTRW